MKTAKRITAIFLCFVMLLGVSITSASALEIGDTVEFTYIAEGPGGYDYTETWIYAGMAKEGINTIQNDDPVITLCYEFNVENSGYYAVTYRYYDDINVFFTESYENGKAMNSADLIINDYEDEFGTSYFSRIYYLEAGVHLIGVTNNSDYEQSFKIEYFADSITDVKFEDEKDKYLLEDYDDPYIYDNNVCFSANHKIEFSNSKTVEFDWVQCIFESDLVKGENTVSMVLPGFEKEITIYYYETSDFIESVELSNVEEYLDATEYYDGDFKCLNRYSNEQVKINYKDGTSQTIDYDYYSDNYITLPIEKKVHFGVYYSVDERTDIGTGKFMLYCSIGYTHYFEKECNVKNASFKENSDRLKSQINKYFNWIDFDWYISKFLSTGNAEYLKYLTESIGRNVSYIFKDISKFIRFYI